jgi:hypothetical protein
MLGGTTQSDGNPVPNFLERRFWFDTWGWWGEGVFSPGIA